MTKYKLLIIFSALLFGGLFLSTKPAQASATCTRAYPTSPGTTATSGTMRVYATGVAGAGAVWFPAWNTINGQNDLVWYPGTNAGSGTWYGDVNIATHFNADGYGTIAVDVWMYGDPNYCGSAAFHVGRQPISSLDGANCSILGGWSFDPDDSADSNAIHIYNNGTFLMATSTSGLRQDVNNAYGISGNHGWTVSTPSSLYDGVNHTLNFYAIDNQGDGNPLFGTANVYCPPSATISASPTSVAYGGSSTISWSSTNTTTCALGLQSGPGPTPLGGTGGLSGSWTATGMTGTSTYFISCNGGGGVNVGYTVTITVGAAPPTCTSATPDGTVVYDNTTQRVAANGVSGATNVLFPTWSAYNGQDDLVWYGGTNAGGGTWYVDINMANHPGDGTVYTHVYMFNADNSNVWCDQAYYTTIAPLAAYISASPTSVPYNGSSTITWNSTSASTCAIGVYSGSGPVPPPGTGGLTGSWTATNMTSTVSYFVSCNGVAGGNVGAVSPTITVAASQQAYGYLDSNANSSNNNGNCTSLGGWAWDPDYPDTAIQVHIYNNGSFYTNISAGDYRGDLPGNKYHAFSLAIPAAWKDGATHTINVYAIDLNGNGNPNLVYSPITALNCPPPTISYFTANGQSGSTSINYNTSATLAWSTLNATSCILYMTGAGVTMGDTGWRGTAQSNVNTGNLTYPMTYTLQCTGPNGSVTGTVTVNINPKPTCTSATPDGDWTIATSGTRPTYANGVTNATNVLFPTWSDPGGQDDLIWHQGTNLGGGTWEADIPLDNTHPGLGTINVHVYMFNANYSNEWCDSASFTRLGSGQIIIHSDTPTSWTVTCPLVNPACPTYTGSGTDATYSNAPSSTWTVQPANKPGYQVQVSPNTSQAGP